VSLSAHPLEEWASRGTYTDPQKFQRASKETEEMRFAVQPNG